MPTVIHITHSCVEYASSLARRAIFFVPLRLAQRNNRSHALPANVRLLG